MIKRLVIAREIFTMDVLEQIQLNAMKIFPSIINVFQKEFECQLGKHADFLEKSRELILIKSLVVKENLFVIQNNFLFLPSPMKEQEDTRKFMLAHILELLSLILDHTLIAKRTMIQELDLGILQPRLE